MGIAEWGIGRSREMEYEGRRDAGRWSMRREEKQGDGV